MLTGQEKYEFLKVVVNLEEYIKEFQESNCERFIFDSLNLVNFLPINYHGYFSKEQSLFARLENPHIEANGIAAILYSSYIPKYIKADIAHIQTYTVPGFLDRGCKSGYLNVYKNININRRMREVIFK